MSSTSSASGSDGEDYEHWPSSPKSTSASTTSVAASGYTSRNGLRVQTYEPANTTSKKEKKGVESKPKKEEVAPPQAPPAPKAPQQVAPQPVAYSSSYYGIPYQPQPQPQPQYVMAYGPGGYGAYPVMSQYAPAPAYYPPQPLPAPAVEEKAKPKPNKERDREVMKWRGRTKSEVASDDQKIAAREGAYASRKMEPLGLKSDQVVWVVEVGGENTLRTYADACQMQGEWKADPRFEGSWYFVREKEGKEGK